MKRKILSFALSALLLAGTAFGVTACRNESEQGGVNGGNTNQNGGTILPGTVITDESVRGELLDAIAGTEPAGLVYSASASIEETGAGETSAEEANPEKAQGARAQKLVLEGAARFTKTFEADLFASVETDGESAGQYLLGFVRADGLYSATGETEGKADFAALKTRLKAKEEQLVLERSEDRTAQTALSLPAAVKLLKNLTNLIPGTVTKTEGGYSLAFDVDSGVVAFLKELEPLAAAIDQNAEMTLTALFSQSGVSSILNKLLDGITAKELTEALALLPEAAEVLPEAGDQTAKEYVEGLLRSGTFYEAITGKQGDFAEHRTFGEVPLNTLVKALSDGELDLTAIKLGELVASLEEELTERALGLLLEIVGIEGELVDETLDLAVRFEFDENKTLLGFSLDALAEGKVASGESEENEASKTDALPKVRFAAKLSATCRSAPELFDLKGCVYRGEEETLPIA